MIAVCPLLKWQASCQSASRGLWVICYCFVNDVKIMVRERAEVCKGSHRNCFGTCIWGRPCRPLCLCSWRFFVLLWQPEIRLWLEEDLTCCACGLIGMQQWHEWNRGYFLVQEGKLRHWLCNNNYSLQRTVTWRISSLLLHLSLILSQPGFVKQT